ncbi:unnamed protein product [Ostreobium quekettii]|uniref:Uncharacterized protein n=1 Tax=Ostreobium quekettii TaxID=121088 RepID=A0A8S1IKZ4_9CHLO|nr:unnamed protein product [Ostreobium quekettii]|eukprot:evm.model.scf_1597.2 EVM.evm.TU.scf_1597.2   scf_1597:17168-19245(-)
MVRHLLVTGAPGVGKSTLVSAVVDGLRARHDLRALAGGFVTEEVRGPRGRTGFDVMTLAGERGVLARVARGDQGGPFVGKYAVDVPSFERVALPALTIRPGIKLMVVDEIGKMEVFSGKFCRAVEAAMDGGPLVLGVVPLPGRRPVVLAEALKAREDVDVFCLTRQNRDEAVSRLCSRIADQLDEMLAE